MRKQSTKPVREWLSHEILKSLRFTRMVAGGEISDWTSIDGIETRVRKFSRYREVVESCFSARRAIDWMVVDGVLEVDVSGDLVRLSGGLRK